MLFLFVFCLLLVVPVLPQSLKNPDISAIGDLRFSSVENDAGFESAGVELAIQSYLNPYSRANVYLHFHDDEKAPVDLEEAAFTLLRGLPLDAQFKFGKYKLPLGLINQRHPHQLPFMDFPVSNDLMFGEEPLAKAGAEFSFVFPFLGQFNDFRIGIADGNFSPHDHGGEEPEMEGRFPLGCYVSYSLFMEMSDFHFLNILLSSAQSSMEPANQNFPFPVDFPATLLSAGGKYKWRGNDRTSLVLEGELLHRNQTEYDPSVVDLKRKETVNGAYGSATLQFFKSWFSGMMAGVADSPEDGVQREAAVYAGFAPIEETMVFRGRIHRDITLQVNRFDLQVVFSLGPHRAHQF